MEINKFKCAWIWFWYNDITRLCVLLGLPTIIIILIAILLFGSGEYLRIIAGVSYILFFGWAVIDNDYSKLRHIGMDEYRRKI